MLVLKQFAVQHHLAPYTHLYSSCCFKYQASYHSSVVEGRTKLTYFERSSSVMSWVSGLDIKLSTCWWIFTQFDFSAHHQGKGPDHLNSLDSINGSGRWIVVPLDDKDSSFLPWIVQPEQTVHVAQLQSLPVPHSWLLVLIFPWF